MTSRLRALMGGVAVELATAAVTALTVAAIVASPLRAQTPTTPPVATAAGTVAPAAVVGATTPGAPTSVAATAGAATQTAAPSTERQSMYADRRNFSVGDIVTILIDDYTITTAIKENVSSDTRSRGLSLAARLPTSSKSVGLDTRNDASQNQRGSAKRENRFQNEMSVRVVAVGQNGLLQLKGTKNINVDKNVQDITLTGWVRAQDISLQNMIESAKIADATIGYTSPGNLNKPKQGMISKILGAFWP